MEQLTRHPLSTLWGDMPEDQYREFVEGIRERHRRQMIMILDGKILDGWHRYKACLELGIEPFLAVYTEDDPVGYVIRLNAMRRHLTPGQRAACIVACHEWAKTGRPQKGDRGSSFSTEDDPDTARLMGGAPGSPLPATVSKMAEEASVSERTIQRAKVAEEAGLGDAVRSGELSPKAAATQARQQPGAPPKPKGPTLTERLEAQVDALQMEVHEKAQRIEGLERELREARAQQSEYPHEREAVANEREAMISALHGSVNEWQTKHNDERRRANWWERQARSRGWKREGQAKPPDADEEVEPPEFPIYEGWDGQEHGEF